MARFARFRLGSLALLVLSPGPAAAESFVVSSGTALVAQGGPGLAVAALVTGDASSLRFRWYFPEGVPCAYTPCGAGDVIRLDTLLHETIVNVPPAENTAVGDATFDGVSYAGLAFGGSLSFSGRSSFTLPPLASTDPAVFPVPVNLTGPFSFRGTLFGYRVLDVREPQLVFTASLVGRGTATAVLLGEPSLQYSLYRTRYDFEPVPEPASVVLFGTGLLAACGARRLPRSLPQRRRSPR